MARRAAAVRMVQTDHRFARLEALGGEHRANLNLSDLDSGIELGVHRDLNLWQPFNRIADNNLLSLEHPNSFVSVEDSRQRRGGGARRCRYGEKHGIDSLVLERELDSPHHHG